MKYRLRPPAIAVYGDLLRSGALAVVIPVVLLALVFPTPASGRPDLAYVQVPPSAEKLGGGVSNTILASRYYVDMQVVLAETSSPSSALWTSEGFVCATDPAFSVDGSRLVFSGKRSPEDALQLWEITIDDPEPSLVVASDYDCVTPRYLPNGHIIFASLLSQEYEEHGGLYSLSLYEWIPGRDAPSRISFNPSSDFDPAVLRDGRLIFSSWQHVGNHFWPRGNIALNLINWDGTGIFPLTGNHRAPWLKRGATPLDDERVVFVQSDELSEFGGGALMATSLNDALSPYQQVLSPETYEVSDAALLAQGTLLVSARKLGDAEGTYDLYVENKGQVKALHESRAYHELNPAVHTPAFEPDTRFSTVLEGTPFGYLLILNVFETDRMDPAKLQKNVGTVRVIEGMPPRRHEGQDLEFLTLKGREEEPMVSMQSATGYVPSRILGEVPPASDGSVYLKVPADRPLRLQLVDRDGFTMMNERSWIWVRPNERRTCIGCHENRELSPHNAVAKAAKREPTDLTDPATWKTVTFKKDLEPLVKVTCAVKDCHMPPVPTAGMNLVTDLVTKKLRFVLPNLFGRAYSSLLKRQDGKPAEVGGRRLHPGDSRNSPLLWMLYGRVLGTQYYQAPFDTPIDAKGHPGPMLTEEQLAVFRKWVDLGAVYQEWTPTVSASTDEKSSWSRSQSNDR